MIQFQPKERRIIFTSAGKMVIYARSKNSAFNVKLHLNTIIFIRFRHSYNTITFQICVYKLNGKLKVRFIGIVIIERI